MIRLAIAFVLMLTAQGLCADAASADEGCRKLDYLGAGYTVCTFDPATSGIRLYEYDRSGKPYGSFKALEEDLRGERVYVRFAMNGGMYDDNQGPVGLYVENFKQLKAVNTNSGWGNFHLMPNGVFYLQADRSGMKAGVMKAGVMETKAFAASAIQPFYATQSGPMLVIDGKLHPAFLADSTSFKTRNGVGVTGDGKVVFALSEDAVRFHDFATLYRDVLGCPNALFLDGSISSIDLPEWQRRDSFYPLGPIIAVTEMLPGEMP